MKIHILSDLHTEFAPFSMPDVPADIRILAGDTGTKLSGLTYALEQSKLPTVYIAGNHEYYKAAIPKLTESLRKSAQGSHVHFLENELIVLDGVRFLGCTLWTDFLLLGADLRELAMHEARQQMNDYKLIRKSPEFGKLRPVNTCSLHLTSKYWLEDRLSAPFDGKTVVVTHHAPSARSLDPQFPIDYLSAAYASNLESIILDSKVDLWIHGHTHHGVDYRIGATRIISNQRGYPDAPAAGFVDDLVLTL